MGNKDVISKELLKKIARDIATHILKIEIKDDMELIDKEFTRVEKRDADLLFKNGNDIVHIEVQNANHKQMHLRMHRYYSDILFEFEAYNIRQYMLYIGKYSCSMKHKIQRDKIDYSYDIIDIADIPCESLLNSNDASAVVLAILCDFEGRDKQEVVNLLLQRLKALSDEKEYKNYLKMVNILSSNRDLEDEVKRGTEMLSVDIEKTPFYQIGIEKGMERGIEQGIEKVVVSMLKLNIDIEIIQKSTGLTLEAIEALKKKI
ncbi:MAG: Unknown protein [uncultured Sulfurovum sp.]|uniref:Transposase (putative) YhgA-like domain-containing protein n=1 Tax=uncultured Sulfurovum sp. TaxID=269237 RepID=A0A6S6UHR4_9BACT|nr:MAG: Unknown protein [uncultured Sulfurovum sp.]